MGNKAREAGYNDTPLPCVLASGHIAPTPSVFFSLQPCLSFLVLRMMFFTACSRLQHNQPPRTDLIATTTSFPPTPTAQLDVGTTGLRRRKTGRSAASRSGAGVLEKPTTDMRTRPHRDWSLDDATNGCLATHHKGQHQHNPQKKNIHLALRSGTGYPAYPIPLTHKEADTGCRQEKHTQDKEKQREYESRGGIQPAYRVGHR